MDSISVTGPVLQRSVDWVFGYDFFISYGHKDGLKYAKTLKSHLETTGYKVCLDQDDYVAGDDLPSITRRRVQMSRKLVVIARPAALHSDWVRREVDIFSAKGRAPIIINVNQSVDNLRPESALAQQIWEAEWLRIEERLTSLDADVSNHVIQDLVNSFDATRQETKRFRFFVGIAIILAMLAFATGVGWYNASIERRRAENNEQRAISGQVDLHIKSGMSAVNDGHLWAAAVWFAEALRIDHERGAVETNHRTRLAAISKQLPVLRWIWFVDKSPNELTFLPASRQLIVIGDQVQVLTPDTAEGIHLHASKGSIRDLKVSEKGSVYVISSKYDQEQKKYWYEVASWDIETTDKTTYLQTEDSIPVDMSVNTDRLLLRTAKSLQVRSISTGAPIWHTDWKSPTESWRHSRLTTDGRMVIATTANGIWLRDTIPSAMPSQLSVLENDGRIFVDNKDRWLAVAGQKELYLWNRDDMETAPVRLNLAEEVSDFKELIDLDFNPDGKHLVSTVSMEGGNRISLVWRIKNSNHASLSTRINHEEAVERWAYNPPSPGGVSAAAGAAMGMGAGKSFEKAIRFSPDGRMLATVSDVDEFVRVWDWRSSKALTPPLGYNGRGIESFAFAPDGAAIAVATNDNTIRLWEIVKPSGDVLPFKTRNRVDSLRFSANGDRLVYEGNETLTTVLNLLPPRKTLSLKGHTASVSVLALSEREHFIATGSYDKTVRVYKMQSGEQVGPPLEHKQTVDGLVFHGESKLLSFAAKWDGPSEVCVWEIPAGLPLRCLHFTDRRVDAAAFNSNGTCVVLRFARRNTYNLSSAERLELSRPVVWNLTTDVWLPLDVDSSNDVEGVGFAADGTTVWTYVAGEIQEFDSKTGSRKGIVKINSPFRHLLAVSPDGHRLAVGKWESQVQVVDRRTGKALSPQMDHQTRAKVEHASFSGDGARLLTVSDEQVRVWSANTGSLLAPPFTYDVRVNDATLDDSGHTIAISIYGRRDGKAYDPSGIYLWSLDENSSPVERLRLQSILASGHRVDSVGGFVPLSDSRFRETWTRFVDSWEPPSVEERIALWHRQQAVWGDLYGRRFHEGQLVIHLGRQIRVNASAELYAERARLLIRLHGLEQAEGILSDLKAALELDPGNRALRRRRGQYYAELKRLDLAIDDLRQAFDLDRVIAPQGVNWTDVRNVYQLAFLALRSKDQATYKASCRRAIVLFKAIPDKDKTVERWNALYFAAWTCILGKLGELEELDWMSLAEALKKIVLSNPEHSGIATNAQLLIGALHQRIGKYQLAEAAFEKTKLPPYDRLLKASMFARQGHTEKATALLALARKDISKLREQGSTPKILGPWWPDGADIADLLAAQVIGILP